MKCVYFIFLALLSLTASAQTQTVFTGIARDLAGKPLEGVLIEVETTSQPPASAFSVSGSNGQFKLTLSAAQTTDSVRLSGRALGYTEQMLRLVNRTQVVPLTMHESSTLLKEVTVQGNPITRSHDTLSYQVGAFATKQDRVISDVLKKMPGIEVASDGQISYEGRPISKFYINGQDLLEGRYNLASENLPAGAVQSVQVLENHQPIRALDSLIRPDNAALNIKLKRGVTATGQARLGTGLGANPLGALYNANLSPMLFTPKQQLLDTFQGNNTGQDVAAELKPLTVADLQQQSESNNQKPDLTHIQGLGQPPVAANRYLFNQVQLLSTNELVNIGKQKQLRVNVSYLHDRQAQRGNTQTVYYLPGTEPVKLTEEKYNTLYFNTLQTDLTYTRNIKDYYLKNTLSVDSRWDSQAGEVYQPEQQVRIRQMARNPFLAFTNRLGLVRPVRAGGLLQVTSLVFYNNSPQQLTVTPGPLPGLLTSGLPYDTAQQRIRLGSFFTSNSVTLTATRKHWGYTGTVGGSVELQRLTSALATISEPSALGLPFRNDLHWARYRAYAQPALSYKTATWNATFSIPISYYNFRTHDDAQVAEQHLQVFVSEPRLSARFNLGDLWYASGSARLNNGFGDISQLNYAYILRDYRTVQRNAALLPRTWGQSYSGGIYFKDPLKSLFFYANYSFSNVLSNRLYSSQIDANGALTTVALDQDSRRYNHSLSGVVSKFISPWKTNLSLNLLGNISRQPQILNGTPVLTQSRTVSAIGKANVSAFSWGSLDYSTDITALRSTVEGGATQPLTLLQDHHVSLSIFPVGHHALTAAVDYYDSQGPNPTVRAVFADLTYRYTPPTIRKIDLEVRWNNIFDTRQYQYSSVSDFILVQNTYRLRPTQIVALIRLSL